MALKRESCFILLGLIFLADSTGATTLECVGQNGVCCNIEKSRLNFNTEDQHCAQYSGIVAKNLHLEEVNWDTLTNLSHIDLSGNSIREIKCHNFRNLRNLDASKNLIKSIEISNSEVGLISSNLTYIDRIKINNSMIGKLYFYNMKFKVK